MFNLFPMLLKEEAMEAIQSWGFQSSYAEDSFFNLQEGWNISQFNILSEGMVCNWEIQFFSGKKFAEKRSCLLPCLIFCLILITHFIAQKGNFVPVSSDQHRGMQESCVSISPINPSLSCSGSPILFLLIQNEVKFLL